VKPFALASQNIKVGVSVIVMLVAMTAVGRAATTTLTCEQTGYDVTFYGATLTLELDSSAQTVILVDVHNHRLDPAAATFGSDVITWQEPWGRDVFNFSLNRVSLRLLHSAYHGDSVPYLCKKVDRQV
jgi:hypothetical protein